jgi:hypothetical protein
VKSDEESATICVATEPDVVTNTHYIIPVNHGATHRVPKYGGSTDRPWRMFGLLRFLSPMLCSKDGECRFV